MKTGNLFISLSFHLIQKKRRLKTNGIFKIRKKAIFDVIKKQEQYWHENQHWFLNQVNSKAIKCLSWDFPGGAFQISCVFLCTWVSGVGCVCHFVCKQPIWVPCLLTFYHGRFVEKCGIIFYFLKNQMLFKGIDRC